jgi:uroporphyrin-III C-methyltransferase/precorrin-2 dehydrogenase/sirohydrochlorin ferrochelatase
VGAGPGARDLLTLRAVERLQEADVIFYDRLVDEDVLELARRDAERVFVGKVVGASAWPQERICDLIVAAARQGKRVVRLKSGDPMLFGRATEELEAAAAAGIPTEVVPGVTAACAASAALGRSLTERGVTDTVVFCTGRTREGDARPDWMAHAQAGTTLAFYMSVGQAGEIAASLKAGGVDGSVPVLVARDVEKPTQAVLETTLDRLAVDLDALGIGGCSIVLIRLPKAVRVEVAQPVSMAS